MTCVYKCTMWNIQKRSEKHWGGGGGKEGHVFGGISQTPSRWIGGPGSPNARRNKGLPRLGYKCAHRYRVPAALPLLLLFLKIRFLCHGAIILFQVAREADAHKTYRTRSPNRPQPFLSACLRIEWRDVGARATERVRRQKWCAHARPYRGRRYRAITAALVTIIVEFEIVTTIVRNRVPFVNDLNIKLGKYYRSRENRARWEQNVLPMSSMLGRFVGAFCTADSKNDRGKSVDREERVRKR